ncbi:MAG: hypothetical protein KAR35_02565 [Candidatus Heimdallarchaeota archaeon]|nr:hypothetical protein [Candidatus Heimdallarchaeota archaeon]MCK5048237.1 hypothetical protein [Candidatus Heimdallarchaeota archaeon]
MSRNLLFYPENALVPPQLKTEELLIRPLRATDVELDYKAVMDSQVFLLIRSNGRWPREGFTIEENLKDLERHEKDFHDRKEFTYTIMNHSETRCLGCIYITPLVQLFRRILPKDEFESYDIGDYEATVSFWMTPDCIKQDMDKRLLENLVSWFKDEWSFSKVSLSFGFWLTDRDKELVANLNEAFQLTMTSQSWKLE